MPGRVGLLKRGFRRRYRRKGPEKEWFWFHGRKFKRREFLKIRVICPGRDLEIRQEETKRKDGTLRGEGVSTGEARSYRGVGA